MKKHISKHIKCEEYTTAHVKPGCPPSETHLVKNIDWSCIKIGDKYFAVFNKDINLTTESGIPIIWGKVNKTNTKPDLDNFIITLCNNQANNCNNYNTLDEYKYSFSLYGTRVNYRIPFILFWIPEQSGQPGKHGKHG